MQQKQFLDFLDMIDGGGAGQMGDRFEGGGLYSILANLVANPYGSEDEERRAARQKAFGIMDMASQPSMPRSAATPPAPPSRPTPPARSPQADAMAAQIVAEAQMGLDPFGGFSNSSDAAVYSGRGNYGMPYPNQKLEAFNQAMETVPAMLRNTGIAEAYRDYLLNGGVGTFNQFTGAEQ